MLKVLGIGGSPRKRGNSDILLKISRALNVDPDRLLLRATLTPILRPVIDSVPSIPKREPLILLVNDDERRHLENYLLFLRCIASVESSRQKSEAEYEKQS